MSALLEVVKSAKSEEDADRILAAALRGAYESTPAHGADAGVAEAAQIEAARKEAERQAAEAAAQPVPADAPIASDE